MKLPKGGKWEGNMPGCSLTPELFDSIVGLVANGNFRTTAYKAVGVAPRTFWDWMEVGRTQIEEIAEGKRAVLPLQAQLVIALDMAEGQFFSAQNAKILDGRGSVKDRTLRFAWLQRRFAREWAPPAVGVDDETGAVKPIDNITEILIARLQALKDADG